jgi:hypothetical protein
MQGMSGEMVNPFDRGVAANVAEFFQPRDDVPLTQL